MAAKPAASAARSNFAILKRAPALLEGRYDLVTAERAPQRDGCALVKEDEHGGGYASARLR